MKRRRIDSEVTITDAFDGMPVIPDFDYGLRDFDLTDPWGHRITFGEGLDRIEARENSSS